MDRWILVATTISALAVAVAGIVRDRRKPQLDDAQAEHVLVNSSSVKATIKKMADDSNMARDRRIIDLEDYLFNQVRPWARDVVVKFDMVSDLLRAELWTRTKDMPDIHIKPFPEMPEPPKDVDKS